MRPWKGNASAVAMPSIDQGVWAWLCPTCHPMPVSSKFTLPESVPSGASAQPRHWVIRQLQVAAVDHGGCSADQACAGVRVPSSLTSSPPRTLHVAEWALPSASAAQAGMVASDIQSVDGSSSFACQPSLLPETSNARGPPSSVPMRHPSSDHDHCSADVWPWRPMGQVHSSCRHSCAKAFKTSQSKVSFPSEGWRGHVKRPSHCSPGRSNPGLSTSHPSMSHFARTSPGDHVKGSIPSREVQAPAPHVPCPTKMPVASACQSVQRPWTTCAWAPDVPCQPSESQVSSPK